MREAVGIAHRDDPFADAQLFRASQRQGGQLGDLRFDLDDGHVRRLVRADDGAHVFGLVMEPDLDQIGSFDDVVVGEDVTGGADDHAGAQAGLLVLPRIGLLGVRHAEEILERAVVEEIVVTGSAARHADIAFAVDADHRGDGLFRHVREHLLEVVEPGGKPRFGSRRQAESCSWSPIAAIPGTT